MAGLVVMVSRCWTWKLKLQTPAALPFAASSSPAWPCANGKLGPITSWRSSKYLRTFPGLLQFRMAHFELQHLWNCCKVEFSLLSTQTIPGRAFQIQAAKSVFCHW
ncbi:hypothetical protein GE09DRAFT_281064 [Coniochaeta sp. 2T2.1]|nr:hypothetical protein GE09DRAFT_281064 [Coniochaeta sp. 2T2.1]